MLVPTCASTPVTNADGSLACSSGWVYIDYSPLFPSITLAQAYDISLAVLLLWATAWGFGVLIRQLLNSWR